MKLTLKDTSLLEPRARIGDKWVAGKKQFPVINPATGEQIAAVADLGVADAKAAINAAHAAQKSWAAKTALERADLILAFGQQIADNVDDLAVILTAEMGKPLAEARGEIMLGVGYLRWFAEEGRRVYGDIIPGHLPDKRLLVLKQPVGVVGMITPWNFPNAMLTRKIAPALAAGCAIVARPAESTPLSATALTVLAERAGLPDGLFNVITSEKPAEIGLELCTNQLVRKLSFTGSTEVGRILMRQSAENIQKLSLELGGNAPFIVFDDADLEAAVAGAVASKYRNAGQTCICANRIYVQRPIYEAFAEKMAAAVSGLKIGNGMEDGVQIGPLINDEALAKVEDHLADALAAGASLAAGGERIGKGLFFQPTLLTGVEKGMRVLREETFGPLAPLVAFDQDDEVVEQANDTEFGLAAYIYTNNLSRVWKVSEALEYGMVGVNTAVLATPEAPFGGVKSSGLGREGSKYGIEDFLEIKYLQLSL